MSVPLDALADDIRLVVRELADDYLARHDKEHLRERLRAEGCVVDHMAEIERYRARWQDLTLIATFADDTVARAAAIVRAGRATLN